MKKWYSIHKAAIESECVILEFDTRKERDAKVALCRRCEAITKKQLRARAKRSLLKMRTALWESGLWAWEPNTHDSVYGTIQRALREIS